MISGVPPITAPGTTPLVKLTAVVFTTINSGWRADPLLELPAEIELIAVAESMGDFLD